MENLKYLIKDEIRMFLKEQTVENKLVLERMIFEANVKDKLEDKKVSLKSFAEKIESKLNEMEDHIGRDEVKKVLIQEYGEIDEHKLDKLYNILRKRHKSLFNLALQESSRETGLTWDDWLEKIKRAFNFAWFWIIVGLVIKGFDEFSKSGINTWVLSPIITTIKKSVGLLWDKVIVKIFKPFLSFLDAAGGLAGKGIFGGLTLVFKGLWYFSPMLTILLSTAIVLFVSSFVIKVILFFKGRSGGHIIGGFFEWKDLIKRAMSIPINIWNIVKKMFQINKQNDPNKTIKESTLEEYMFNNYKLLNS